MISPKQDTLLHVKTNGTLLEFLMNEVGSTRTSIKSLLSHRLVSVNGTIQTRHDTPVNVGDIVTISHHRGNQELRHPKVRILFEDANFLIVEKRNGILTVPANLKSQETTVFSILKHYVKKQDVHNGIYCVHRLERETSGLLIWSKSIELQRYMREYWDQLIRCRGYVALVEGNMDALEGDVRTWISEDSQTGMLISSPIADGGKPAHTHYRVIRQNNQYALLELQVEGANQIRTHMASIAHPIVGDHKFAHADCSPIDRLCLHANRLEFINPVTEQTVHFETHIPKEFGKVVAKQQTPKE